MLMLYNIISRCHVISLNFTRFRRYIYIVLYFISYQDECYRSENMKQTLVKVNDASDASFSHNSP